MSRRFFSALLLTAGGACLLALAGCGDADPLGPSADGPAPAFSAHAQRSQLNMDLAAARAATARFHRLDAATDAGYEILTECLALPDGSAAMGYHYGNLDLFDETLEVDSPEALVYAPWPNGELRLVAVEWIVPLPLSAEPPELMGHEFHANEEAGVWGLHAWVWQHNPDGMFADFNPRVSCDTEGPA